jgi:uracil-DNA glycosylase family 4
MGRGEEIDLAGDAQRRLSVLFEEARACTRCPSMEGHPRILGPECGVATARCLVLGEAPGWQGAAQTGVPLHGDRAGETFERLLEDAGIRREDVFVSNAVLCVPRDPSGEARAPAKREIASCTHFVRSLIDLLDPALVVTLGGSALASTDIVAPHGLSLRWDAGEVHRWFGRFLLPLYHPGARTPSQRPWAKQREDYALWASLLYG